MGCFYLKLTQFDGGVYVRATKKVDMPCMYKCKGYAEMHSREEKIILFLEQDFKFFSLLKGIPPQQGLGQGGGNAVWGFCLSGNVVWEAVNCWFES